MSLFILRTFLQVYMYFRNKWKKGKKQKDAQFDIFRTGTQKNYKCKVSTFNFKIKTFSQNTSNA